MKEIPNVKLKQSLLTALLTASTAILNMQITYADAFEQATRAVGAAQSSIVNVAKVLFPFSLVILIIAILFTHDQKALATELKTALIICVAYVVLLIVADAGFANTFQNIFNGTAFQGGTTST